MNRKLRILCTNDDGIDAPGLIAMVRCLAAHHDVCVVAPDRERSAVGHGISVYAPISVREAPGIHPVTAHAVFGTPADCVKAALGIVLKDQRPDLVVSGINRGQNTGTSVLYSGTVAAALEGAMSGIPALAVSLGVMAPFKGETPDHQQRHYHTADDPRSLARTPEDFEPAAHWALRIINATPWDTFPPTTMLNVNVPFMPPTAIRGIRTALMGMSAFIDEFAEVGQTEAGATEYANTGNALVRSEGPGQWDDILMDEGYVAVTPLHIDLTNHGILPMVDRICERLEAAKA